jgi:Fe-Mn family superoxide dismutase
VISARTLEIHHGRHHAKYVETVNAIVAASPQAAETLEDVIRRAAASDRKLFNNAAQAWNHAFYWASMTPRFAAPQAELAGAIRTAFGDLQGLREAFLAQAAAHFGSGWAWLAVQDGALSLFTTHDADTVVSRNLTPLRVCDLWEHAYYLDHQNARAAYLSGWWDRLAHWDFALAQFRAAASGGRTWRYPAAAPATSPA